ncbi:YpdA family putative bacillithiol disulfide reductase [Algoriphagus yeomjeoni]|uniref:Thioredoxin reductase (NADPH) n=1 Tax=Algoriphagus yeomjeoni TaxID=291403 RepID=A0A327P7T5_9BACT|nr:YpdA family putative bacillithiol disulfide reductase [Algoriphagus yeomjeoni]RAI86992.1 thioredoxin reductase (NADPH) [Algoriphagus yeomjeoni]
MAEKIYDLLIVGGGPIGLACGVEAGKAGLDYVIIEKGALTNSIYNYPINMTFFSTSDRLEMANIPFMSIGNKPTRTEALEYYRRIFSHFNLNIKLYEPVETLEKKEELFHIKTSKDEYLAKNIAMATGFYDLPNLMNIPGEDLPKVKHYYKEPWPFINQNIVVVGGANSAVDAALETWRKGAEVSMVLLEDEVDQAVKYWVRPDIVNRIKEGSIKAFTKSTLKEIREHEVVITTPEGEVTIENDFVLAMTGYKPNFGLLNQLGVKLSEDEKCQPEYNGQTHESNVPGVYLAGVVCGGLNTREFFIENSVVHAGMIVKDIVEKSKVRGIK